MSGPEKTSASVSQESLARLNAAYARCIDNDRLEDWPGMFFERCHYRITTADNHRNGYPAGMIYADSRGMLTDRIASLRKANVFEPHAYRHIIGASAVLTNDGEASVTETPFLVVRIMRTGDMDLFATGRYLDRVEADEEGSLKFRERVVVCDNGNVDTLLVIPL
jgi:3-phenylpropionate/cinnamic acid dioxygenase small subunit